MNINEHNTIGQTNSQILNPARQARQNAEVTEETRFGKLVSEIAKQKESSSAAAKPAPA